MAVETGGSPKVRRGVLRRLPPPAVVVQADDGFPIAGYAADAMIGEPAELARLIALAGVRKRMARSR